MGHLVNRDYEPTLAHAGDYGATTNFPHVSREEHRRGWERPDSESEPGECQTRSEHARGGTVCPNSGHHEVWLCRTFSVVHAPACVASRRIDADTLRSLFVNLPPTLPQ